LKELILQWFCALEEPFLLQAATMVMPQASNTHAAVLLLFFRVRLFDLIVDDIC
jgi:hypothetical protein